MKENANFNNSISECSSFSYFGIKKPTKLTMLATKFVHSDLADGLWNETQTSRYCNDNTIRWIDGRHQLKNIIFSSVSLTGNIRLFQNCPRKVYF